MFKLSESFSPSMKIIDKTDFKNRGNVVHDNIGTNLLLENLVDHIFEINSVDHDAYTYTSFDSKKVSPYNNPFNFVVSFGGLIRPAIPMKPNNIKYVRIDNVIMPKTNVIVMDNADPLYCTMSTATTNLLENQKMLILKIVELKSNRKHFTGTMINDESFVMMVDRLMGLENAYWTASHKLITYPNSCLGNINRLSLKLYNQYNAELNVVTNLGDILNLEQTIATQKFMYGGVESAIANPVTNIPILQTTMGKMQTIYEVTFGIIDNELNTEPKFGFG